MSFDTENNEKRSTSLLLWLAACCSLCSAMGMGAVLGWSSPGLPSMSQNNSTPFLSNTDQNDEDVMSWIGSSTNLGALAGGLLGGPILGFIGMKKSIIGVGIPFVVGWLCILFAKSVPLIIVGRVITGLGAGIACAVAPTYCNQISTPNVRGLLGTGFQIFVTIGILYIDVFGISTAFDWRWLCIPAMIPSILMSVGMLFMPESPVWLMNKYGRGSQVEDALRRLRSFDSDVENELKELEDRIEMEKNSVTGFSLNQLKRPDVFKPFIIVLALMFFQQFSGINAVCFYAADIFQSAGSTIDPNINAVIVTGTMVVATIIGGLIIDKLGRKMLLLISGSGHVISLILIGYYFYNAHQECPPTDTNNTVINMTNSTTISSILMMTAAPAAQVCDPGLGWLPVVSLIVFVFMFSIGYGPIPWMITAEITPRFALNFISSIATAINWFFAFIVTLEFKNLQEPTALSKYGAFWLFAGICAASVVFTALFVPESKGKTQEEMSEIFCGQQNDINNNNKSNGIKVISSV